MDEQKNFEEKIAPVRKQLVVPLPQEAAFRLFCEKTGSWWPLATHSVGEDQAETCYFEGWVGGRIVEVIRDGRQVEWGRVLVWEPFRQVRFTWHPGRAPDTAQEVSVTFAAVPGGTQVTLIHTGWETLGEKAAATRAGYENGWKVVLDAYSGASM